MLSDLDGLIRYEPKILIAFVEAIARNAKIHRWLTRNGYPELGALAASLQADAEAFDWLIKHKYPHFAAFSNAIDLDKKAKLWLLKNKFPFLHLLVDACFLEEYAIKYLKSKDLQIFIIMSFKIRELKTQQQRDYEDYHKIHI
jgi:hypothetical protein